MPRKLRPVRAVLSDALLHLRAVQPMQPTNQPSGGGASLFERWARNGALGYSRGTCSTGASRRAGGRCLAVGRGHGGLSLGLRASSAVSVASGGHRGRFGSTHACAKIPPFPPFPRGWSVSAWARRASTSGALQRRVVARESRWRARPKSAAAAACRGQRGLPAYPSPWPSERGVRTAMRR